MKKILSIAAASLTVTLMSFPAVASEYTMGTVKKIDMKAKKVTIIHQELKSLDMPAMTMVFRVADEAMLEMMAEGSEIGFKADRVEGKLTVIELRE